MNLSHCIDVRPCTRHGFFLVDAAQTHRSVFDRRREVRYAALFLREFWIIAGVGVGEPVFPGLCLVWPFLHLDTPVGRLEG